MNLYTNTMPFDTSHFSKENTPIIIPIGSTFAMIAVSSHAFLLKPPKSADCGDSVFVVPEIFKIAFKEVELDK